MADDEIQIEGCVKQGVEAGCIILVTQQGKEYSLHGKSLPTFGKGLGVTAKGRAGGLDTCMQGTPFQVSSWNWNRQKCPTEETGTALRPVTGKCSGWKAWHDRMPGSPATLHVTGECVFPDAGYKVRLVPRVPQGINPSIYIIDRVVEAPTGNVAHVVTTVNVHYTEETQARYESVDIQPDGVSIPVKQVQ